MRRRTIATALCASLIAITGCGSSSSPSSAGAPPLEKPPQRAPQPASISPGYAPSFGCDTASQRPLWPACPDVRASMRIVRSRAFKPPHTAYFLEFSYDNPSKTPRWVIFPDLDSMPAQGASDFGRDLVTPGGSAANVFTDGNLQVLHVDAVSPSFSAVRAAAASKIHLSGIAVDAWCWLPTRDHAHLEVLVASDIRVGDDSIWSVVRIAPGSGVWKQASAASLDVALPEQAPITFVDACRVFFDLPEGAPPFE